MVRSAYCIGDNLCNFLYPNIPPRGMRLCFCDPGGRLGSSGENIISSQLLSGLKSKA